MSLGELRHDERAIEGLPIRLVIALVVGVASLAVMMSVIDGMDTLGVTELETQPQPEIIEPEPTSVDVNVVDPDGTAIANATIVAKSGTARLESIATAETGHDGVATLELDPELGPNQQEGTVKLDIRPPGGEYADKRENTDVLVIRG
ncbi:DUF7382 domain-containing protein [Halovenus marina]|uniref:DUF7382 domain-containing protein n=1 Tax=Halovenus marina TaxID=3396621 RepID=UPI003F563C22